MLPLSCKAELLTKIHTVWQNLQKNPKKQKKKKQKAKSKKQKQKQNKGQSQDLLYLHHLTKGFVSAK